MQLQKYYSAAKNITQLRGKITQLQSYCPTVKTSPNCENITQLRKYHPTVTLGGIFKWVIIRAKINDSLFRMPPFFMTFLVSTTGDCSALAGQHTHKISTFLKCPVLQAVNCYDPADYIAEEVLESLLFLIIFFIYVLPQRHQFSGTFFHLISVISLGILDTPILSVFLAQSGALESSESSRAPSIVLVLHRCPVLSPTFDDCATVTMKWFCIIWSYFLCQESFLHEVTFTHSPCFSQYSNHSVKSKKV